MDTDIESTRLTISILIPRDLAARLLLEQGDDVFDLIEA